MSGRKPSDAESEQENEQDSEQIEMVKNTAQEPDETSAELVVVSNGLREKRKVETGEKAEKRARKGKQWEGFVLELIQTESISFRSKKKKVWSCLEFSC